MKPYFSDMSTRFHIGLTPTLKNFLYSEYGQTTGFDRSKVSFVVKEALGILFGTEPLEIRERFIDYSTVELKRRKNRLAKQEPA